jgi:uncharacterized membrane protein
MILQIIDLNTFVKGMNVLDVDQTTRGTIVYTYMVGYFVLLFKLLLQLLTLVVLVTLIMWIIVAMTHMLKSNQEGGGSYSSAADLRGGESGDIGKKMKAISLKVVTFLMGTLFLKNFFLIFLFIIPMILLIFLIMYSQFYDRNIIIKNDNKNAPRIMNTNHSFIIMIITMLLVFGILILCIYYMMEVINMDPDSDNNSGDSGDNSSKEE